MLSLWIRINKPLIVESHFLYWNMLPAYYCITLMTIIHICWFTLLGFLTTNCIHHIAPSLFLCRIWSTAIWWFSFFNGMSQQIKKFGSKYRHSFNWLFWILLQLSLIHFNFKNNKLFSVLASSKRYFQQFQTIVASSSQKAMPFEFCQHIQNNIPPASSFWTHATFDTTMPLTAINQCLSAITNDILLVTLYW